MQVITFHLEVISRGKGRSIVQLAAYCAREKIFSDYEQRFYSTNKKNDLVFEKVMLPDHAPKHFLNRGVLWNEVERVEKFRNSRLARSFYYSLPRCLNNNAYIDMTQHYIQNYFVNRGMCADVFIHDKGDGNPHVHTLVTTRSLDSNGQWENKRKRIYLLNPDGTIACDPETYKHIHVDTIKVTDWDDRNNVEIWRKGWAEVCNMELEHAGFERVTHMSYARQGLDKEPTKHEGHIVRELAKREVMTDRYIENKIIKERNHEREMLRIQRELDLNYDYSMQRSR